jgi:hydrogenase-4 membrane subunit HyfE
MSMRRFPASLTALRTLAVVAVACAAVAAFTNAQFRYRDFFGGITVGILVVLVIALFTAHAAEVEGPGSPPSPRNGSDETSLRKRG